MFVETVRSGKKIVYLIRETYRENGKVRHRTIANISHHSPEEILAVTLALKHKERIGEMKAFLEGEGGSRQGKSVGAVHLLHRMAERIGIKKALGDLRSGRLALWQVMARVIDQGSRLSAVRLATQHAACEILDLDSFSEDDLYRNLDWICDNQGKIENSLFRKRHPDGKCDLFLYDVTSSYLEGTENELAAFGYNRDGKKGKKQVVVGLLCDADGFPLSIEVFPGNTPDTGTFASQVKKAASRFGGGRVTFIGDRGMIKIHQMEHLESEGFHYITAITKPQIETLLRQGIIEMTMFDKELAEIDNREDGLRYILRRNPFRAREIQKNRESKFAVMKRRIARGNQYLSEHPRARVETQLRLIHEYCRKVKLNEIVIIASEGRTLSASIDPDALMEASKLDGCYVIKTNLPQENASASLVHERYKDLAVVEQAFRISKTAFLEMRPIHVRTEQHTRAHAFVVMLAYIIAKELIILWKDLDLTVEEGIKQLSTLCAHEIVIKGIPLYHQVPEPRESVRTLFEFAGIDPPKKLPVSTAVVASRKKLPSRRISRS